MYQDDDLKNEFEAIELETIDNCLYRHRDIKDLYLVLFGIDEKVEFLDVNSYDSEFQFITIFIEYMQYGCPVRLHHKDGEAYLKIEANDACICVCKKGEDATLYNVTFKPTE